MTDKQFLFLVFLLLLTQFSNMLSWAPKNFSAGVRITACVIELVLISGIAAVLTLTSLWIRS